MAHGLAGHPDPEFAGMSVDLHASRLCQVDMVDGTTVTPYVFAAPATVIVGDLWLTMNVGDRRIAQAPAGVVPRLATEADVLGG